MTISPDQSLPAPNASSTGNDLNSGVPLPGDKNNNTDSLGTMPDSEVKPSLETAFQSKDEDAQAETKESSSDKLKRIIAEMAASQSNALPPEREEGIVASKKTSEDQVPVAKEEPPANVSSEIRPEPTDNVKAMPPAKLPPVQTADLNPPVNSTPSTKPVPQKGPTKQPVKKKPDKAGNKMARVKTAPSSEEKTAKSRLEGRLRSFLQNYCSTYAAKDLAKFTDFFISGARENGKPFESLLPKYQKNFDQIETIQYRIELQQYTYDSQNETVRIEGNFLLKWLPSDKKWRENSGKIFMNLKDDGRSFLVQRLDYYGNRQTN
jgi:general secretion pathway protein A